MLAQLLRTERAVEPDDQRIGVADAVPERLDRLAGQRSARGVDDRPRDDQRQRASPSSSKSDWTAKIAAFALSVSKIVSIRRRSAPPSTRPAADSR